MKRRRAIWTMTLTIVLSMFAIGMGSDTPVKANPDLLEAFRIDGSWRMTVAATNPPGLQPFDSLMTFNVGGGLVETRRLYLVDLGPNTILETPGAGNWRRIGFTNNFDITFIFLLQGAPGNPVLNGAPVGTDKIRWRATLNPRTGELKGPWLSTLTDNNGNVLFTASGILTGKRIPIEPI